MQASILLDPLFTPLYIFKHLIMDDEQPGTLYLMKDTVHT